MSKFLPLVRRFDVSGVALYALNPRSSVSFEHDVTCIMGANGIGKSTYLTLLNYALTGLVPDPDVRFLSVDEYASDIGGFARDYFAGRIEEGQRESARVTVEFSLGPATLVVTRGFFGSANVTDFLFEGEDREVPEVIDGDPDGTYRLVVPALAGFTDFNQFAFMQLFVATFDERRHLLFWDQRTIQAALFLSLGIPAEDAERAESLGRLVEKADSNARNARWRATQARYRLNELDQSLNSSFSDLDWDEFERERDRLERAAEEAAELERAADARQRDCSRALSELLIARNSLEHEFAAAFAEGPVVRSRAEMHPAIHPLIDGGQCEVCGTPQPDGSVRVREALASGICPLCDSPLLVEGAAGETDDRIASLQAIDDRLREVSEAARSAQEEWDRTRLEFETAKENLQARTHELTEFYGDARNAAILRTRDGSPIRDNIIAEIDSAMVEVHRQRQLRDELKVDLDPLVRAVASAYGEAEATFVPQFRVLAQSFLGRPVDIELERSGMTVSLRFDLDSTTRRDATQLSESQKYFVDIALRMSLLSLVSANPSTLVVDTPEGSLDIAYETRAGQLFGQFVGAGHRLAMTANVNSSSLVKKLAQTVGSRMALVRMTDWVELSDVQLESADLFVDAYAEIERHLVE